MKYMRKGNTRRELGNAAVFRRQFNYCSWWDGNLTLHLHAGKTILTVIAIPHVSGPSKNARRKVFIIYYSSSAPPVLVSPLLPPDQCHVQIRKDEPGIDVWWGRRPGWWESDIFIRGFVRLGFSVWGQKRLQRHMPSIQAPLMRIICSHSPGTRMRTFNTPEG